MARIIILLAPLVLTVLSLWITLLIQIQYDFFMVRE